MTTYPTPTPTPQPTPHRLLGVWAHPDDEAYLSAGLMARVVEAGGQVTVVTLTDGERGFADSDPRPSCERAELRRAELRAAMAELGVDDIRFAGHPDGGLDRLDPIRLARQIGAVMRDVRPDTMVTFGPDGMTGHPDHVACGHAATLAWSWADSTRLLFATKRVEWMHRWHDVHRELGVWMDDGRSVASEAHEWTLGVDLAGPELDRKRTALGRHASQTDGVVAALGEASYRDWIGEEVFRRPRTGELGAAIAAAVERRRWMERELAA